MRKLKESCTKALLYSMVLLLGLAPMSPARAQQGFAQQNPMCVGTGAASDVPTIQGIECLVANILASAITLVGIVAFVMFLIGGFQYLTAGANAKGVEQSKNSISFAILGIVVALASFLILSVIANLTGVKTILQFRTQYPTDTPSP